MKIKMKIVIQIQQKQQNVKFVGVGKKQKQKQKQKQKHIKNHIKIKQPPIKKVNQIKKIKKQLMMHQIQKKKEFVWMMKVNH